MGSERPPRSYAVLSAGFGGAIGGALVALRAAGKPLPKGFGIGDVLLGGVATHNLSRLLAKDRVTSFMRAPFTEYQGPGGPGEVEEKPRRSGLSYAVGELLTCPYCLGLWVAAGYGLCLVGARARPASPGTCSRRSRFRTRCRLRIRRLRRRGFRALVAIGQDGLVVTSRDASRVRRCSRADRPAGRAGPPSCR